MVQVAKLVASLFANTSEFEAGMKRASKQWRDFKKEAGDAAKYVSVGLGATATALGALAVKQALAVDAQAKLSRSIGVSLQSFQALNLVAHEAGVDQETLAKSLRKTQVALVEASKGSKEIQQAFSALGLHTKELLKLTPDKQFEKIATALDRIKNPAEKTALAIKIFGREGGNLIPMLEDFSRSLDDAKAFTEKFGVAVSEIDANKIEEANDAFGRVGKAAEGFGNVIAIQLSPFVTEFSNVLLDNISDAKTWSLALSGAIDEVAKSIDYLRRAFVGVKNGFQILSDATVGAATTLAAKITGDEELAKEVAKNTAETIRNTIDETKKEVSKSPVMGSVTAVREGAQKRSVQKQATRPKVDVVTGNIVSETDNTTKFKAGLESLERENGLLHLNISLQGKKDSQIEAAHKLFEINSKFAKEGVVLTKQQTAAVAEQISKYEELAEMNEKVQKAEQRRKQLSEDLANSVSNAFEDAIINGKKLGQTLKSLALDMVNLIAKSALKNATAGFASTIGNGIGSFLGNLLPSFDIGSSFVPNDMTANIHKGEMIIPAKQAGMIRSGGMGGANVVQNITIGAGVSATVRQEVAKMLPDIKRATIAGVQDSSLRGKII